MSPPRPPLRSVGDPDDSPTGPTELIAPARHLSELLGPAFDRFQARAEKRERPIPLPWPKLSEALGGGLWPGCYFLVGNTGSGKTQWAMQVALWAALNNTPTLYISLELGELDLVARLASLVDSFDERTIAPRWSDVFLGRPHAVQQARRAVPTLEQLPFHVEFGGPMGWPHSRLRQLAAFMRASYPEPADILTDIPIRGGQPMLIVLDFAQIVASPEGTKEELRERIAKVAYGARAVARDFDAAVLLISSTARENYGVLDGGKWVQKKKTDAGGPVTKTENTTALGTGDPARFVGLGKESGEVEYAADAVLVLAREQWADGKPPPGGSVVHLAIAKRRAGPTSWCRFGFNGSLFTEPTEAVERNITGERQDDDDDRGLTT